MITAKVFLVLASKAETGRPNFLVLCSNTEARWKDVCRQASFHHTFITEACRLREASDSSLHNHDCNDSNAHRHDPSPPD